MEKNFRMKKKLDHNQQLLKQSNVKSKVNRRAKEEDARTRAQALITRL